MMSTVDWAPAYGAVTQGAPPVSLPGEKRFYVLGHRLPSARTDGRVGNDAADSRRVFPRPFMIRQRHCGFFPTETPMTFRNRRLTASTGRETHGSVRDSSAVSAKPSATKAGA